MHDARDTDASAARDLVAPVLSAARAGRAAGWVGASGTVDCRCSA
ncbi:hypothetical protein [Mycobacterium intracellulare]|nr:hypothetical protein [Mycobacterium intracellulare]